MGIDTSAKLLYGIPYAEIPEEILDEVNEMLYDGEIEYASPYYDSPRDEWIVGVEVSCDGVTSREFEKARDDADRGVPEILSELELKYYVSAHVS